MSHYKENSRVCNGESMVMLFKDREGLTDDLQHVINVPELCDVKFLVGPDRLPVYGVRAILSTRSRVFYQYIIARQNEMRSESQKNTKLRKVVHKIRKILRIEDDNERQKGCDVITKVTIRVESFDVRVFERMIRYVHCGIVTVDAETVIGLMNAAKKFEFQELQKACWDFTLECIGPKTLPSLMATASYYSHFKETRKLVQRIISEIQNTPNKLSISRDVQALSPVRIGEYML